MENVSKRPEYKMFHAIKQRCNNPNCSKYPNYGGRGIKICDRWMEKGVNGFINFLEDMGDRPEGDYSIERIDVNGNYEPENCKWITMSEQSLNKRNTAVVKEGDVFGKLTVIKEVESLDRGDNSKRRMFLCQCECGNKVVKRMDKLRLGNIVSCGLKPCNKYCNHTNKVEVL
jgi:hypothetical protein